MISDKMSDEEKNQMKTSRRGFLAGSAGFVAGLAAGSLAPAKLVKTASAAGVQVKEKFPYKKLEPSELKLVGRNEYHGFGTNYHPTHCSEGSFRPIVLKLREKVGKQWNNIPTTIPYWSHGGGMGWAVLCGGVVGATTALQLVLGHKDIDKAASGFWKWYIQYPFPQYKPPSNAKGITKDLGTSVSKSVQCHQSVTNWCIATGYASGSPERSERCSRLTGECAAKAAKILNAAADGELEREIGNLNLSLPAQKNGCRGCHFKGPDLEEGQWTRGKMNCIQCHEAPHLEK